MNEFKGTKGKWEIEKTNDYHEDCRINHIPNIGIYFDENSDIEPEEIDANLLLISKAPEMLDMLKKLVERLEENDLGRLNAVSQAKQLIKEATQL
jgi:hypothetical protein